MLNEIGQRWDGPGSRLTIEQVAPKRDAQLATGLFQAGERISTLPSELTSRSPADFLLFDLVANIGFAAVGMQWNLRALEHQQQLVAIAMDAP